MAGRFRERTWSVLPSRQQWEKLSGALSLPDDLRPCWDEIRATSDDYEPRSDCRGFTIGDEPKPDHPSPKPLSVMKWFLEVVGGESVCDPFMGSGTTGVAAVKIGRRFVGIEIHEPYFDIACRRIEGALKQPDMFIEKSQTLEQLSLTAALTPTDHGDRK